jgi:hypothetical protein
MTKFRTYFVAGVALFFVTAPARATLISPPTNIIEDVNITFANTFTLTGQISVGYGGYGYNGYNYPTPGPTGLYLNGESYWGGLGVPNGSSINAIFWNPPSGTPYTANIAINLANLPAPLTASRFILSGVGPSSYAGITGTVKCVSGCGVYSTPLPATLPMLISAFLSLSIFAWRRNARLA